MAKQTQMERESAESAAKERPWITSEEAWKKVAGPEFGGQADILQINVGEVAGPFEYIGHQPMVLEGNKTVTVHLAMSDPGETLRLPIAASFLRAIDQAEIIKGDKFLIRRTDDVTKKSGVGKGQAMQIYAVKLTARVARSVAAPAAPVA